MYTKEDLDTIFIDEYRVISFDPGSYSLGMAVSRVNSDLRLTVLHSETFKIDRAIDTNSHDCLIHGERYIRLKAIHDYVEECFDTWDPIASAIELPFMGRMASAFGSLKEVVLTLRNACISANPNRQPFMYEPSVVKKAALVSGKSGDKNLMTKALVSLPDIDTTLIDPSVLDEHSVDAILIGYAHLKLGIKKGGRDETSRKQRSKKRNKARD